MSRIKMNLHHSVGYSLVLALVTREHLSCPVDVDQLNVVKYGEVDIKLKCNYLQTSGEIKTITALYDL